jgi:hypothetical protein
MGDAMLDHVCAAEGTAPTVIEPEPLQDLLVSSTPPLHFQHPVPRALVHRAAMAEVFVTGAVRTGGDEYQVAAQWPRDHALYHPDEAGRTDPLLFAETVRQALAYLSHRFYDVPMEYSFIAYDMDFTISDPEALRIGSEPLAVVLETRIERVGHRPPRRYGLRAEVVLRIDGKPCARGGFRTVAVEERTYLALRSRGAESRTGATPGAPGLRMPGWAVGRLRGKDCLLEWAVSEADWRLAVDTSHAIFFDHPLDHVPLMVITEGFRQLGHLLANGTTAEPPGVAAGRPYTLASFAVECGRFAELGEPVSLVVREDRADDWGRHLKVDAVQGARTVAGATMQWAPAS